MRLVQIQNGRRRRVALVEEPNLRLLRPFESVYDLADHAIARQTPLAKLIGESAGDEILDYDSVYNAKSDWHLLVPFDHPIDSSRTLVCGTGLTHLGSARDRQAMHTKAAPDQEENLTDSMKMFRWGVELGRPDPGRIGIAPEWFYKGNGAILRAHAQPLDIPVYAEDGGEEAEIAGLYLIGPDSIPRRIGMAVGNEFSDHKFEKRNYLNLAGSKIRACSIGPEIVIDPAFDSVPGEVRIERGNSVLWSKSIRSGQAEMCHSLQNIEHHHFKFETHRRPGDVHVHFYGACALSFGDGVQLTDGDTMVIRFDGFGRALQNSLRVAAKTDNKLVSIVPMG